MIREIDVRAVLPAIHVPTLVIQRLGDRINPPFYGRYLASHISGARYFEQPGDHVLRFAEGDELFEEIDEFLSTAPPIAERTRILTTILITQAAGTDRASERARAHEGRVRHSAADGLLVTFDAPGQAIRCAAAIRDAATHDGDGARTGIHTGEVDLAGDNIEGTALEIARSIAGRARPGEALVSRAVKDLVVGSGIAFEERGSKSFTDTGEVWPLCSVTGA